MLNFMSLVYIGPCLQFMYIDETHTLSVSMRDNGVKTYKNQYLPRALYIQLLATRVNVI